MKPIIATTLAGLFVKREAWNKAHVLWYQNAAEQLNDKSVLDWIDRPDYFKGVDQVMKRLYPKMKEADRTVKARRLFFDSVVEYLEQNPQLVNREIVDYFTALKPRYTLALITTNTQAAMTKILKATGLESLFDLIETSKEEEKDDKALVFARFTKKHSKPTIYIGGDKKDSFEYCTQHKINCLYANLEAKEEIPGVASIHNLEELRETINRLS